MYKSSFLIFLIDQKSPKRALYESLLTHNLDEFAREKRFDRLSLLKFKTKMGNEFILALVNLDVVLLEEVFKDIDHSNSIPIYSMVAHFLKFYN